MEESYTSYFNKVKNIRLEEEIQWLDDNGGLCMFWKNAVSAKEGAYCGIA